MDGVTGLQATSLQWNASLNSIHSEGCDHQSTERPQKRIGAARAMLGGAARQRLSRSRSTAEQVLALRGSENPAPTLPHPAPAPLAVLSDVTNTTRHQLQVRSTPGSGLCLKPPSSAGLACDTGSTCTSTPPANGNIEADLAHAEDPQHVVEYLPDIYRALQREEGRHLPQPGYMERQPHVNSKMRAILVDWLTDVHKKYKLRPETLFLAISLVDRFLEKRSTLRRHLQLVGVTALLIAAKFEELYPPQIHDFVHVTDKAYTTEEVIRMEVSMLTALDFVICRPTAVHFMERYQCVNGCSEAHRDLAQYLLELTLIDYKMVKYSPSHLAAAAILLSNKLLRRQPSWTPAAVKHTKMTEQMLKECAKEMCGLLEHAESNPLQAVRKKFSQLKHHSVAKLNFTSGLGYTAPTAEEPRLRAAGRRCSLGALPRRGSVGGGGAAAAPAAAPEELSCGSAPGPATGAASV